MAQAVGWEAIQATCRRSCSDDEKLPELKSTSELARHKGDRVRVRGKFRATEKPSLTLEGSTVALSGAAVVPELVDGFDGKTVSVVGVLRSADALDAVSTVALAE